MITIRIMIKLLKKDYDRLLEIGNQILDKIYKCYDKKDSN